MSNFFNKTIWSRAVNLGLLLTFGLGLLLPAPVLGQALFLPPVGVLSAHSPVFAPVLMLGVQTYPDQPLRFDFIMDAGDSGLQGAAFQAEADKLIRYFLASLTVPEEEMWVNLSPDERDRIIPDKFGRTRMGRDLLAQDYLLKQVTASMIYPEQELGQAFWQRIYARAKQEYGVSQVPVDTFNKVWIVPQRADVYVNGAAAFVTGARLKVMLAADYLAARPSAGADPSAPRGESPAENAVTAQIVREVIIPELEQEVNEGERFAGLRQVFWSHILATWYKRNLTQALVNQHYSDRNAVTGIADADPAEQQQIYQQYLQTFQDGIFNYIREDQDPATGTVVPRKYFAGGVQFVLGKDSLRVSGTMSSPARAAMTDGAREEKILLTRAEFGPGEEAVTPETEPLSSPARLPEITDADLAIFAKRENNIDWVFEKITSALAQEPPGGSRRRSQLVKESLARFLTILNRPGDKGVFHTKTIISQLVSAQDLLNKLPFLKKFLLWPGDKNSRYAFTGAQAGQLAFATRWNNWEDPDDLIEFLAREGQQSNSQISVILLSSRPGEEIKQMMSFLQETGLPSDSQLFSSLLASAAPKENILKYGKELGRIYQNNPHANLPDKWLLSAIVSPEKTADDLRQYLEARRTEFLDRDLDPGVAEVGRLLIKLSLPDIFALLAVYLKEESDSWHSRILADIQVDKELIKSLPPLPASWAGLSQEIYTQIPVHKLMNSFDENIRRQASDYFFDILTSLPRAGAPIFPIPVARKIVAHPRFAWLWNRMNKFVLLSEKGSNKFIFSGKDFYYLCLTPLSTDELSRLVLFLHDKGWVSQQAYYAVAVEAARNPQGVAGVLRSLQGLMSAGLIAEGILSQIIKNKDLRKKMETLQRIRLDLPSENLALSDTWLGRAILEEDFVTGLFDQALTRQTGLPSADRVLTLEEKEYVRARMQLRVFSQSQLNILMELFDYKKSPQFKALMAKDVKKERREVRSLLKGIFKDVFLDEGPEVVRELMVLAKEFPGIGGLLEEDRNRPVIDVIDVLTREMISGSITRAQRRAFFAKIVGTVFPKQKGWRPLTFVQYRQAGRLLFSYSSEIRFLAADILSGFHQGYLIGRRSPNEHLPVDLQVSRLSERFNIYFPFLQDNPVNAKDAPPYFIKYLLDVFDHQKKELKRDNDEYGRTREGLRELRRRHAKTLRKNLSAEGMIRELKDLGYSPAVIVRILQDDRERSLPINEEPVRQQIAAIRAVLQKYFPDKASRDTALTAAFQAIARPQDRPAKIEGLLKRLCSFGDLEARLPILEELLLWGGVMDQRYLFTVNLAVRLAFSTHAADPETFLAAVQFFLDHGVISSRSIVSILYDGGRPWRESRSLLIQLQDVGLSAMSIANILVTKTATPEIEHYGQGLKEIIVRNPQAARPGVEWWETAIASPGIVAQALQRIAREGRGSADVDVNGENVDKIYLETIRFANSLWSPDLLRLLELYLSPEEAERFSARINADQEQLRGIQTAGLPADWEGFKDAVYNAIPDLVNSWDDQVRTGIRAFIFKALTTVKRDGDPVLAPELARKMIDHPQLARMWRRLLFMVMMKSSNQRGFLISGSSQPVLGLLQSPLTEEELLAVFRLLYEKDVRALAAYRSIPTSRRLNEEGLDYLSRYIDQIRAAGWPVGGGDKGLTSFIRLRRPDQDILSDISFLTQLRLEQPFGGRPVSYFWIMNVILNHGGLQAALDSFFASGSRLPAVDQDLDAQQRAHLEGREFARRFTSAQLLSLAQWVQYPRLTELRRLVQEQSVTDQSVSVELIAQMIAQRIAAGIPLSRLPSALEAVSSKEAADRLREILAANSAQPDHGLAAVATFVTHVLFIDQTDAKKRMDFFAQLDALSRNRSGAVSWERLSHSVYDQAGQLLLSLSFDVRVRVADALAGYHLSFLQRTPEDQRQFALDKFRKVCYRHNPYAFSLRGNPQDRDKVDTPLFLRYLKASLRSDFMTIQAHQDGKTAQENALIKKINAMRRNYAKQNGAEPKPNEVMQEFLQKGFSSDIILRAMSGGFDDTPFDVETDYNRSWAERNGTADTRSWDFVRNYLGGGFDDAILGLVNNNGLSPQWVKSVLEGRPYIDLDAAMENGVEDPFELLETAPEHLKLLDYVIRAVNASLGNTEQEWSEFPHDRVRRLFFPEMYRKETGSNTDVQPAAVSDVQSPSSTPVPVPASAPSLSSPVPAEAEQIFAQIEELLRSESGEGYRRPEQKAALKKLFARLRRPGDSDPALKDSQINSLTKHRELLAALPALKRLLFYRKGNGQYLFTAYQSVRLALYSQLAGDDLIRFLMAKGVTHGAGLYMILRSTYNEQDIKDIVPVLTAGGFAVERIFERDVPMEQIKRYGRFLGGIVGRNPAVTFERGWLTRAVVSPDQLADDLGQIAAEVRLEGRLPEAMPGEMANKTLAVLQTIRVEDFYPLVGLYSVEAEQTLKETPTQDERPASDSLLKQVLTLRLASVLTGEWVTEHADRLLNAETMRQLNRLEAEGGEASAAGLVVQDLFVDHPDPQRQRTLLSSLNNFVPDDPSGQKRGWWPLTIREYHQARTLARSLEGSARTMGQSLLWREAALEKSIRKKIVQFKADEKYYKKTAPTCVEIIHNFVAQRGYPAEIIGRIVYQEDGRMLEDGWDLLAEFLSDEGENGRLEKEQEQAVLTAMLRAIAIPGQWSEIDDGDNTVIKQLLIADDPAIQDGVRRYLYEILTTTRRRGELVFSPAVAKEIVAQLNLSEIWPRIYELISFQDESGTYVFRGRVLFDFARDSLKKDGALESCPLLREKGFTQQTAYWKILLSRRANRGWDELSSFIDRLRALGIRAESAIALLVQVNRSDEEIFEKAVLLIGDGQSPAERAAGLSDSILALVIRTPEKLSYLFRDILSLKAGESPDFANNSDPARLWTAWQGMNLEQQKTLLGIYPYPRADELLARYGSGAREAVSSPVGGIDMQTGGMEWNEQAGPAAPPAMTPPVPNAEFWNRLPQDGLTPRIIEIVPVTPAQVPQILGLGQLARSS